MSDPIPGPCVDNAPCLTPSKSFYTSADEWINLQCSKWNDDTVVAFEVFDYSTNPSTNLTIFNSSYDEPIPEQVKDYVKINDEQNGVLYKVKDNRNGVQSIYCVPNNFYSPPVDLNYISDVILSVSSPVETNETTPVFTPDLYFTCNFSLTPKKHYKLSVDYYFGDQLLGSIIEKRGMFGPENSTDFKNPVKGLLISGDYNPEYTVTISQVGAFSGSDFYCAVSNLWVDNDVHFSPKVKINSSPQFNSSSPRALLSITSLLGLIAIFCLNKF